MVACGGGVVVVVGLNCGCWSHTVGIRLSGGMRVSGPPWHAAQGPSESPLPHDWLSPADGLGPNNGQTFVSSAIFQPLHEAHPQLGMV